MARPRKDVKLDASDEVIVAYFDQAMALKDNQRGVSSEITSLNSLMQVDTSKNRLGAGGCGCRIGVRHGSGA
jgi:hypothetical protein